MDLFPSHKALLFAKEAKKLCREFINEKPFKDVIGSKRCIRENTLQNTEKVLRLVKIR